MDLEQGRVSSIFSLAWVETGSNIDMGTLDSWEYNIGLITTGRKKLLLHSRLIPPYVSSKEWKSHE